MTTHRQVNEFFCFRRSNLGPLVLLLLGCFFAYQAIKAGGAKERTLNAPTTLTALSTPTSAAFKKIQNVRVGERAAPVKNPTGEFDYSLGREVDPATWRKLALRAEKRDGTFCDIELLRPIGWINERAAQVGGSVYISVPECGIDGNVEVLSIGPCPPIQQGTGPVVIGTFAHQSAEVINVYVEGLDEPIGVTVNHPFWSDTRQEFVAAGDLLSGEQLHGIKGNPRITNIKPRGPPEPVYNVEVLGEHVYEVSAFGLLVHNANTPLTRKQVRDLVANLRNGLDVRVANVTQARQLLDAMPDLRPMNTAFPVPPTEARLSNPLWKQSPGTFRGDLINVHDPTGPIHPDLPEGHPHRTTPHYNIKFHDKTKATILIEGCG